MNESDSPAELLLSVADGVVDLDNLEVRRSSGTERLTPKEAALIRYLSAQQGRTVSKERLLEDVWGYRRGVRSRTVETTINRLRAKIEADSANPR